MGVDLDSEEKLLSFRMVDLWFLIKAEIKKVESCKDLDLWMLKKDPKGDLETFVKKFVEQVTLKYSLTSHLISLDLNVTISQKGQTLFDNLVAADCQWTLMIIWICEQQVDQWNNRWSHVFADHKYAWKSHLHHLGNLTLKCSGGKKMFYQQGVFNRKP